MTILVHELAKNCQTWAIMSNILTLKNHKISFRAVIHKRIHTISNNTIESMCEKFQPDTVPQVFFLKFAFS